MIFIIAAAIYGVFKCRFWSYWKWVVAAMGWAVVTGLLVPAYGTAQDPRGSGFLTRWVVSITNDGPGVAAYGLIAIITTYAVMIYLLSRAWRVAKEHKANLEAGEIREEEPVSAQRKGLETIGVIGGVAMWWIIGNAILQTGGPVQEAQAEPPVPVVEQQASQPDQVALNLKAAAVEINEKPPLVIDETTKMVRATAEGRTLTYHYVVNVRKRSNEAFIAYAKAKTIPSVCKNAAMRRDMDESGITWRYAYKFPDQDEEVSMDVDSAACNSN